MKEITKVARHRSLWWGEQIFFLIMLEGSRGHVKTNFSEKSEKVLPPNEVIKVERGPKKGRKRMKEWGEVTFMKEWVKALYIGYHQALDLPKNLFPFPRTGHLKSSLGPNQFLYSKFYGLLKLIFLTNNYNGA